MGNLSYNANLNKYYLGEAEITKEEFDYLLGRVKLSAEYVERIRNGEVVDVPEDIADSVEEQLEYLAEMDKENEQNPPAEEIVKILTGEAE